MTYRVIDETPGRAGWHGFDDDELDLALVAFLKLRAADALVILEYTGEEFEYE